MTDNTAAAPLCTFTIDVWRDESIWTYEGNHAAAEEAQDAARLVLNDDWDEAYSSWSEVAADMDGTAVCVYPAVMAERLPLATMELYRSLAALCDDPHGGDIEGELLDRIRTTVDAIYAADPQGEPGTTVPISGGIDPAAAAAFVVKVAAAHDGSPEPIDYQDHAAKLVMLAAEAREIIGGAPIAIPRVMVMIDQGLIRDVVSDLPVEWFHIDYDTEGADADDLYVIVDPDGDTDSAFRSDYRASLIDPAFIDRVREADAAEVDDEEEKG